MIAFHGITNLKPDFDSIFDGLPRIFNLRGYLILKRTNCSSTVKRAAKYKT